MFNTFSSVAVSTEKEDSKLHRCMHCSFKSKTFSNLKRHLTSHTDERAFACSMCNLRFKQKIHLQKHINYIHLVSVNIVLKILRTGKFIIKCKSTVENHPGEKIVNSKHYPERDNCSFHNIQHLFSRRRSRNFRF